MPGSRNTRKGHSPQEPHARHPVRLHPGQGPYIQAWIPEVFPSSWVPAMPAPVVQEAKKPLETYVCSVGTSDLSFQNSS